MNDIDDAAEISGVKTGEAKSYKHFIFDGQ